MSMHGKNGDDDIHDNAHEVLADLWRFIRVAYSPVAAEHNANRSRVMLYATTMLAALFAHETRVHQSNAGIIFLAGDAEIDALVQAANLCANSAAPVIFAGMDPIPPSSGFVPPALFDEIKTLLTPLSSDDEKKAEELATEALRKAMETNKGGG